MAMIPCPECGHNISDKAPKCIHCGKDLGKEIEINSPKKCLECGADLSDSDSCCPSCGCPTEKREESTAPAIQVAEAVKGKASKKKKIAIVSAIAIVVCALSIFAVKYSANKQAEKEFTATYNAYIDSLEKVQSLMIISGAEAEALCNLTSSVWYNAIFEERDSKTDPYTRPDGYFVSDFNTALANLYTDISTTTRVSDIKEKQASVKELIKNMQGPPEGLEKCYDTLSDLHSAYKTLTDLAVSPSGSLTEYSDNKNSAVPNFLNTYDKLDNQIPERKGVK